MLERERDPGGGAPVGAGAAGPGPEGEGRGDWLSGRLVFGLVLLAVGTLWLLDNFGMVESGRILRWWPLLLVAFGTAKMLGLGMPPRFIHGAFIAGLGLLALLDRLGFDNFDVWDLWPLALIGVGASILVRSLRGSAAAQVPGDDNAYLRSTAFWSGTNRRSVSRAFRGGELTAIMGGVEIDLHGAEAAGGRAVVDVLVWWGGIDIRIPEGWRVVNEATVVMGAVEDKTRPRPDGGGTVVVKGLVVMGGVEVKN